MTAGEQKSRVPVIVVAGFLGAGKTTLLNHLLRAAHGSRIAVVVNDFGSVNIDAMLVSAAAGGVASLSNGCMCCTLDTADIDGMFARLLQARPDAIVIEASGVADPADVLRMVVTSRERRVCYSGLVQVVDASEFDDALARHPSLGRDLTYADLVVANKTDMVTDEQAAALRARLCELAPGVPVVDAVRGAVDPDLLFDAREARDGRADDEAVRQLSFEDLLREDTHDHADHVHAEYQSAVLELHRPLDPRLLMRLLDGRLPGVFRMKGFVDFGPVTDGLRYGVQMVGRDVRFTRSAWPRGETPGTTLVVIGAGVDEAALRRDFAACEQASGAGESLTELAMAGVLRCLDEEADAVVSGLVSGVADTTYEEPPFVDA